MNRSDARQKDPEIGDVFLCHTVSAEGWAGADTDFLILEVSRPIPWQIDLVKSHFWGNYGLQGNEKDYCPNPILALDLFFVFTFFFLRSSSDMFMGRKF